MVLETKCKPDVIVIGAVKAGSSWLYEVLKTHPNIFLPKEKKEIRFFDKHYKKGLNWYYNFYKYGERHLCRAEVTPTYLTNFNVPKLIKNDLGSEVKFIVILRNPVNRAISNYKHLCNYNNINMPFEEFINKFPQIIENGLYYKYLHNWLNFFDINNFHLIILEEIKIDKNKFISNLANFLNVDAENFSHIVLNKKINETFIPKNKFIFSLVGRVGVFLRDNDLDFIVNFVNKNNFLNILKKKESKEEIYFVSKENKKKLVNIYKKDIEDLEKVFEINLDIWKYN